MSDLRKVPEPLPIVVTRRAFPDSDEEVEENQPAVAVYTNPDVTQHTCTIKSILYKPFKDPRIKTKVSQHKPKRTFLTEKPGTYVNYDPENPDAPNPPRCRAIKKKVYFNLVVSEVGYTHYKALKTTVPEYREEEWNKAQEKYGKKSNFCKFHGFRMIPHRNESTGMYKERWYNPDYQPTAVYNLSKTCLIIRQKRHNDKIAVIRKAGFAMKSIGTRDITKEDGIDTYIELWANTNYPHGLSLDDAFKTIDNIDIRGRRLRLKRTYSKY